MEEACGLFLTAEREHQRLSARHVVVSDPKILFFGGKVWSESTSATRSFGVYS